MVSSSVYTLPWLLAYPSFFAVSGIAPSRPNFLALGNIPSTHIFWTLPGVTSHRSATSFQYTGSYYTLSPQHWKQWFRMWGNCSVIVVSQHYAGNPATHPLRGKGLTTWCWDTIDNQAVLIRFPLVRNDGVIRPVYSFKMQMINPRNIPCLNIFDATWLHKLLLLKIQGFSPGISQLDKPVSWIFHNIRWWNFVPPIHNQRVSLAPLQDSSFLCKKDSSW